MLFLSDAASLAGILLAAVLGALPPLLGRWSDRQLHLFVAFGAGIFVMLPVPPTAGLATRLGD